MIRRAHSLSHLSLYPALLLLCILEFDSAGNQSPTMATRPVQHGPSVPVRVRRRRADGPPREDLQRADVAALDAHVSTMFLGVGLSSKVGSPGVLYVRPQPQPYLRLRLLNFNCKGHVRRG